MIVNRVSSPVDESELLDHLRAGDEQAWEKLVRRYAGPLYDVTRFRRSDKGGLSTNHQRLFVWSNHERAN
jgi:hypothetical protein